MSRLWLVLGSLIVAAAALPHWPGWWSALTAATQAGDLASVVTWAAALAGTGLLGWFGVVGLVAAVHLPTARRLAPAGVVALAIGAGLPTAAVASGHPLDGADLPNRAVVASAPAGPAVGAPESPRATDTYAVVGGDSLWTICERRLPAGTAAGEIADEVRRWHEHNRHVIGQDPGLILPGQILHAPEAGR